MVNCVVVFGYAIYANFFRFIFSSRKFFAVERLSHTLRELKNCRQA